MTCAQCYSRKAVMVNGQPVHYCSELFQEIPDIHIQSCSYAEPSREKGKARRDDRFEDIFNHELVDEFSAYAAV